MKGGPKSSLRPFLHHTLHLVHRLRKNLIFNQIPLHIPRMGFVLHMFVNDALPQMVDLHVPSKTNAMKGFSWS